MNNLYLTYQEYETGGEPLSDDDWCDYADAYITWNLLDCYKEKPDNYFTTETVQVPFDVVVDKPIYVVYVRYTTGCTFGTTYGSWYIVETFDNIEDAKTLNDSIDNDTYDGYKPWKGYFERFESCGIEVMFVQ